uniref:3-dehydroquinate synthase n=1 Tax=Phaeomonas parva TaxID=124430 RepID=A0A6U4ECF0_9STRA|mmetsp:Transcript_19771/g.59875  ORF Transcript_19771/g.59875 Transcript_19771/m.59875 type:complete len:332 (+) Transcript_19771:263-1258(+)
MELWADLRQGPVGRGQFDQTLGPGGSLTIENDVVYEQGTAVGKHMLVRSGADVEGLLPFVGVLSWLVVDFEDWSMIPLENLVAACDGSGTKVAARITDPLAAPGAAFALQRGVDALIVAPGTATEEAARIAVEQRAEAMAPSEVEQVSSDQVELRPFVVEEISGGHIGDRVCVDLIQRLASDEGGLVGSSATALFHLHGETTASTFVPARPFRLNAGPVHGYILMSDGKTKYLSELKAGDEVAVVSSDGAVRAVAIGRLKIERRPHVLLSLSANGVDKATVFLQQAETVRLMTGAGPVAVTELEVGATVRGVASLGGRHIGKRIGSSVVEK